MAIRLREGRWGLSRIVRVPSDFPGSTAGHFEVAAMRDRLATRVEAHYPPMNEARDAYALPFALIRLQGGVQIPSNADTRLVPELVVDGTLLDLTAAERNRLANELQEWMPAYDFRDWDGASKARQAFTAAGYTQDTPLRRILLDLFEHLGHSEARPRPAARETHNTEFLDDFSTDPAARWTAEDAGFVWDSVNGELDVTHDGGPLMLRYSANGPGSIEHECQVTMFDANTPVSGPACRFDDTGVNDCYFLDINRTDDTYRIRRFLVGVATTLATELHTDSNPSWRTLRLAAEGAAGANVALSAWYFAGAVAGEKPSDPGWTGVDGSPNFTFTDTAADRLDATSHSQCGIAGTSPGGDPDQRHDFWKSRAISDRSGGGAMTGTAGMTFTPTAALLGAGVLAGLSALTLTPTAAMAGQGALAGSAPLALTPSAVLAGVGALGGASALSLTPSAVLLGVGSMAAASSLVFDLTGTLSGGAAGSIEGSAALAFSATATLTGAGAMAGIGALSFTPVAVIGGQGALAGAIPVSLSAAGIVTGAGALAGVSEIVFTATMQMPAGQVIADRVIHVDLANRTVSIELTGRNITV